jgi:hypothetical protein
MPGQHRGAELDDGIAHIRHRHGDARGEHRTGESQRGAEHQVTDVPAGAAAAGTCPCAAGRGVEQPGLLLAGGAGGAAVGGESGSGSDLRPDPLEAIGARLYLLRGGMQGRAHTLREVMWLTGWWAGSQRLLLLQRGPERGHAAGRVAFNRTAADPHGGGDLSLGEVSVVAQHDGLALPVG